MSTSCDDTVKQQLFVETSVYRGANGTFRFVIEWLGNTHAMMENAPLDKLFTRLNDLEDNYGQLKDACKILLGGLDPIVDKTEYQEVLTGMKDMQIKVDDLRVKYSELRTRLQRNDEPSAFSTPNRDSKPVSFSSPSLSYRLPDLPVPKFDGKPDSWISFIDQFDSVIDSQPKLMPAVKLQHLIGALSDEPRRLLQHLRIEAGNYEVARDLLKRRYHNTRVLADTYIAQILNLPEINTKLAGLRASFLNPLLTAYRCLDRLALPVQHWSYMLVHICMSKLPTELKSRFERRYGGDAKDLPMFDQLITFLEDECRHHDNVGNAELVDAIPNRPSVRSPLPRRVHVAEVPPVRREWPTCFLCNSENHFLRECEEFRRMGPRDRSHFVKITGLCYRCMDKHPIASCRRDYRCATCHRSSHHTMLCFNDSRNPEYPPQTRNSVSFREPTPPPPRSPSPRNSPRGSRSGVGRSAHYYTDSREYRGRRTSPQSGASRFQRSPSPCDRRPVYRAPSPPLSRDDPQSQ